VYIRYKYLVNDEEITKKLNEEYSNRYYLSLLGTSLEFVEVEVTRKHFKKQHIINM
jgi:hypothetical protein